MANTTYGHYVFSLDDIKITNLAGSTQEDLDAGMNAEFTPEFMIGRVDGDSSRKALISRIIAGKLSFGAGSMSTAALAIMTGVTLGVSSSSPTEVTEHQIDAGLNLPYFKVYARALDDDAGDLHLLCYKVKIVGGMKWKIEHGAVVTPGFEVECIDDGTHGVVELIQHETATAVPAS